MNNMEWLTDFIIGIILCRFVISDVKTREVSLGFALGSVVIITMLHLFCGDFWCENPNDNNLWYESITWSYIICGVAVGILFAGISIGTKGQLGMGDAVVFALMAYGMGASCFIEILFITFALAFVAAIFLIFVKKKGRKYAMPLLPFVGIAYVITVVGRNFL